MKNLLYLFIILLSTSSCSQNIDNLIEEISEINIVEHKYIGISGLIGKNYKNFQKLSKTASNNQLIQLLKHKNAVVTCYASWALIENKYKNIPEVFETLINDHRTIKTQSGCISRSNSLSSEFYHKYWNLVRNKGAKDETLSELDKIILKQEKPDWLLLKRALDNRVYNNNYKDLIFKLGFEKKYLEAIFYLCNWHRLEYNYELQLFIVEELKKTEFKGRNSSTYYKLLEELIKFNNKDLNEFILHKFKTDHPNINAYDDFKSLLERYYIY